MRRLRRILVVVALGVVYCSSSSRHGDVALSCACGVVEHISITMTAMMMMVLVSAAVKLDVCMDG